jgi:3',5'-cyclic AMP phosphodiesterase CpdA
MKFTRKDFLQKGMLAAAGTAMGFNTQAQPVIINGNRKRVLRIAHITDVHVQPEFPAPHGLASALHEIQNMSDKADIIFNTGDCIMDSMSKHRDRVQVQWDVWNSTFKNENSLEVVHAIGNHDIWGITMPHATIKADNHYGKKWAIEELKLKNRYYSFDKNGWHFIVLDSTMPVGFDYTAMFDDEQKEWLKEDLSKVNPDTYVCVLSHIPILAACVFFDGAKSKKDWVVGGGDMHRDANELKSLFYQHKNVKLCISGHIHLIDHLEYLGVKYLCNGAVSGAWWGGNNQEFPPAFATINLYDDGTSDHEMHYYNWKG